MARKINYDLEHLRNTLAAEQSIDKIYRKVVPKVLKLGIDRVNVDEALFSFDADKVLSRRYAAEEKALVEEILSTIESGARTSWGIANDKVDQLVASKLGMTAVTVNEKIRNRYFGHNDAALAAFLQRKSGGLGLSERVWRYADQFKEEIELSIDVALRDGRSADELSRDVRAYLANPDRLFRRVRDVHGNLVLSKAAKAYHPGRGVYRSSYKNARRLAATEINMAFHRADFERWQQLDMVVGFRVVKSNNHPTPDICDDLKGNYPKTFLFTGWHPHCRCHTEPILKTIEEIKADNEAIMQGQEPTEGSASTVRTVPRGFSDWVKDHAQQIEAAHARGTLPYFIRDNKSTVGSILGRPPRKKTPLEIAAERHANRTPKAAADIQQRWNESRIKGIEGSIQQGYLPQGVADNLRELLGKGQNAFSHRIKFLQQRAARHASRTPEYRATIQQRWGQRHKQIKLKISNQYEDLLGFKTTDKDYKWYLAKVKEAIDSDDMTSANKYLESAAWKKGQIEEKKAKLAAKKAAPKKAAPKNAKGLADQTEHPTVHKTEAECIKQIREMLGCTEAQARAYNETVYDFTYQWDYEIRQVQCGNTNFKLKHGHKLADIKKRAETLEEFIEKSPQWHGGTTYRGMTLSDSELKDVMHSLSNGTFDNRGTASWSTSEKIAKDFSSDKMGYASSYQGETKTNRVVLELSEHKHATSIKHLSHYSFEQEVIASKRCRYRLVKRQERVIDGKKYIYLEVEAI